MNPRQNSDAQQDEGLARADLLGFHPVDGAVRRPRALDLFCGAGGASMGLHRAGFDVTGVDIKPQPQYPFRFVQMDALEASLDGYAFIWASPPCQAFTALKHMWNAKEHANLIPETRARLVSSGAPYVIENVEGAPLGESGYLTMLCGTMFGLTTPDGKAELRRHRLFETSFSIPLRPACVHGRSVCAVYGGHVRDRCRTITVTGATPQMNVVRNRVRQTFTVDDARVAMGIDWMPMSALSQAIPPAYSQFIGEQFLAAHPNSTEPISELRTKQSGGFHPGVHREESR